MSLLGGAGFNTLNNLTPATMQAIQSAIDSFLQTSRFQQQSNDENRRHKEAMEEQEKARKEAEKRNKFGQIFGIAAPAVAGVVGGATLGAGAGIGSAVGASTANQIATPTVESVASDALAAPSLEAANQVIGTGTTAINNPASVTSGMMAQTPAIAGSKYVFGDTLGGSVGRGAVLGLANAFSPGLLNAAADIPVQAARLGLGYANIAQDYAAMQNSRDLAAMRESGLNYRFDQGRSDKFDLEGMRQYGQQELERLRQEGRMGLLDQRQDFTSAENALNRASREGIAGMAESGRMGRHYDTMGLRERQFNENQAGVQNRFDASMGFRQSDADRRYELSRQGLELQQQREGRLGQPSLGDLSRTLGTLEPWGYDPADPTSPMSTELYNQIQGRIMPSAPAAGDLESQLRSGQITEEEFRRRRGY